MCERSKKMRQEQKAIALPLCTILTMAILGLMFAHLSGSNALEIDALVCCVDAGISLVTLWVAYVSNTGPSPRYPIGRMGWVPLLNTAKGILMLVVCLNGVAEAIDQFMDKPKAVDFALPAAYALIVLSFEYANYCYTRRVARRLRSSLLDTEAKEWLAECLSSALIVGAFGATFLAQGGRYDWITLYVDPVLSILLVTATVPVALSILKRNLFELVLHRADDADESAIRTAFDDLFPQFRQHSKRFTVLRIGDKLLADIVLLVRDEESSMTVQEVDRLYLALKQRLRDLPDEIDAKLTLTRAQELLAT